MRWASAISDNTDLEQAVQSCVTEVKTALEGAQPDVAFVFISNSFANDYLRLNELLSAALGKTLVVGCSAAGVIGAGHEIEYRHSLSMTVGELPGVTLTPFGIKDGALPSQDASPLEWETLMGVSRQDNPSFVILADPYSLRAEELLAGLDYAYPASPKLGGLASGGQGPRLNALYLNGECYREGAVGVALTGDLVLDTVVAQGCRPIGSPMRITKCDDNLLEEVDGRSAITVMQELYERASDSDRALMSSSLFLGVVMDELKEDYKTGDFLIRNLLGVQRRPADSTLAQCSGSIRQCSSTCGTRRRRGKTCRQCSPSMCPAARRPSRRVRCSSPALGGVSISTATPITTPAYYATIWG